LAKFDVEEFARGLETIAKNNLNAKITEINAEKGDTLLTPIDAEAFILLSLNDTTVNFDPFVFITEISMTNEGLGPVTSQSPDYHVVVITQYQNDPNTLFRLLRYRRALREVYEQGWQKISNRVKLTIDEISPQPILLGDEGQPHVFVGVSIKTSWA